MPDGEARQPPQGYAESTSDTLVTTTGPREGSSRPRPSRTPSQLDSRKTRMSQGSSSFPCLTAGLSTVYR